MSEETKVALAAIADIRKVMQQAIAPLENATDAHQAVIHAMQRMDEASMLLKLTMGGKTALHANVATLGHAVAGADKSARVVLDMDVDFSDLSDEQIAAITDRLTLAEHAYHQFRMLSTLAMLHLSRAHELREEAAGAAAPSPDELP